MVVTAKPKPTSKPKVQRKKEKLFHPESRKAGQLERTHLRTHKLEKAKARRYKLGSHKNDRYVFFYHALPPDVPCLSLPELHDLIQNIWLKRHDMLIQEERSKRRKGEPRTTKEDKILNLMEEEREEYRSGLEIPDLTDAPTVELFRRWETGDPAYLSLLRFVRVSSSEPEKLTVSRRGVRAKELEAIEAKKTTPMNVD